MSKTTSTRFQHSNSSDVIIDYENKFIIIKKVNSNNEIEEEIFLNNDEIKRINRVINKNLKE